MPQEGEMLGRVTRLTGGDHILVKCSDGETRLCRIRGKMKRRMWIREADIVLIAPWDFKDDRGDIIQRYLTPHDELLETQGHLPKGIQ